MASRSSRPPTRQSTFQQIKRKHVRNRSQSRRRTSKRKETRRLQKSTGQPAAFTPVLSPPQIIDPDEDELGMDSVEEHRRQPACDYNPETFSPKSRRFHDPSGRYQFVEYLGGGAFGKVYLAKDTRDNVKVAIKTQTQFSSRVHEVKMLLREVRCLRLLRGHPCIVELFDILVPPNLASFDQLSIVCEYADTTLRKLFNSNQFLTVLHVEYMMYQILCGIKFIHSASIVHRDLKPENILVNENCTVKICDFGLARGIEELRLQNSKQYLQPAADSSPDSASPESQPSISHERSLSGGPRRESTRHVVTRWYRAPEVLLIDQQPNELLKAIDMWSVGCIFAELLDMISENCPDFQDRCPLFPGRSSFLSLRDEFTRSEQTDQLNCIFNVLGKPTPSDIAAIHDENARAFVSSLAHRESQDFDTMFPANDEKCVHLLQQLLRMNPYERITIDDALRHSYLDHARVLDMEDITSVAHFEFEEDDDISMDTLRDKLIDEIQYFHAEIRDTRPQRRASLESSSRRKSGSLGRPGFTYYSV